MRREVLAIDLAVAVILAALVLILSPGVAVAGMIALIVLLVCVFSVVWDIRRRRRRPGTRRTGSRRTESRRAAPRQSRPRRDR